MDAISTTSVELEESAVETATRESLDIPAFLDADQAEAETGIEIVQSEENFWRQGSYVSSSILT